VTYWQPKLIEAKRHLNALKENRDEPNIEKPWNAGLQQRFIFEALDVNEPVSAKAIDTYNITLPEGYFKQGELYVYQPTEPPAVAAAAQPSVQLETDPVRLQQINNSLAEGQLILRTGLFNGRKLSPAELIGVRKAVESDLAKLAQSKPADKTVDAVITDVTPPGFGPTEPPAIAPAAAKPARKFSMSFVSSEFTPVINAIMEQGGIKPRSRASNPGGEYDEQISVSNLGGFGKVVYGGNRPPDLMAQDLFDAGLLPDPYPSTLWAAIDSEVQSYRRARPQIKAQEKQFKTLEKQADNWTRLALAPAKGDIGIPSAQLKVGDTITIAGEKAIVTDWDPFTWDLTVADGPKFGIQTITDGEIIYAEKLEPAPPEVVEVPAAPTTPAVQPRPPVPTINTQGEGNLIPESEMPFNLTGETDITPELERIAAAKQAAIDKAEALDRDQVQMFSGSGFADAGPMGAPVPPTPPPGVKATDASIYNTGFADAPLASKGPGWTMPVTLGATNKVRPLEVPELIELVKMLTGTVPDLKKFPRALGMFYPVGNGRIAINPKIAGDFQSLAMTLSHEIGHLEDYLPDGTMKRGNILGRIIGSFRRYLVHSMPLGASPTPWPGPGESGPGLTAAERRAIAEEAKKNFRESIGSVIRKVMVEEPIYEAAGIKAQDLLDMFGMDARERLPELYQWFAGLDGPIKKEIIKAAMKGVVDARAAAVASRVKVGTRSVETEVTEPARAVTAQEIHDAIVEAMKAEVRRRNIVDMKLIRGELEALSQWWKPFTPSGDGYTKYRFSGVELYADAISVLLNSPADLEARAPMFWEAFWINLDRKPEVKQALMDIQDVLNKGHDAVVDARLGRDRAAMVKGAEIFMRKDAEARDRRMRLTGWWDTLLDQYWDRYFPASQAVGRAVKAGRMTSAEQEAFRWIAEEHPLGDVRLTMNLADIGRMYQALDAAGVPRLDLGLYLKHHRIVNERYDVMEKVKGVWEKTGESGRSTMANPGGENPKTSQDALDRMQAILGPAAWSNLVAGADKLRSIMHEVNTEAWDSGLYTPEQWALLQSNADVYAAFTPLEYVERYMPAGIKKQVGTFKEIADPAQQTILKMIAIHRAAQQNRFTIGAINAIRQAAPAAISDAPMIFDGKRQVPQRPRDRELELIEWKEQGVRKGAHVQKRFASMWRDKSPAEQDAILRLLQSAFSNTMYNFIIRYNPAFQMAISPLRDNQRSLVNTPGGFKGKMAYFKRTAQELAGLVGSAQGREAIATTGIGWAGMTAGAAGGAFVGGPLGGLAGTMIGGYAGSGLGRLLASAVNFLPIPDNPTAATDWASGDFGRNSLLRQMVLDYAISSPWSTFGGRNVTLDDAISQMLRSFNLQDQKTRGAFMDALMYPLHAIEFAGQTLQALVKVSGYRVMTEDLGIDGKESGAYVRSHFGLPNTSKAGAHVRQAGALVPFLNVSLRSYESAMRFVLGKESKMSRGEYFLSWLLGGSGLLVIMQTLAREGVLGEDLERLYSRVGSSDLTNYIVVPLGETQTGDFGGKTAYVRLPQDEGMRVINGTVHKALTLAIRGMKSAAGQETQPGAKLSDLLKPGADILPGITPVLEIGMAWAQFSQNQNPIDSFRRTPVISSDAFDAGGIPAVEEMTGWTLDKSGLTNFYRYDPRANSSMELKISMTPILNRLVRVSDAGLREQQNAEEQYDDQDLKRIRTEFGGATQGLRREYMTIRRIDAERRTERQQERYEELSHWYNRRYRATLSDIEYWLEMDDKPAARRLVRALEEDSKLYEKPQN